MPTLYLDHTTKVDASLQEFEDAVRTLDGERYTLLIVELAPGKTLTVGGGPRHFVVEVEESGAERWALVDSTRGEQPPIVLVVGGQLVDYPARLCVGIDVVLKALRAFVTNDGTRRPDLSWSVET